MQVDALEDGYTDNDLFSLSSIKVALSIYIYPSIYYVCVCLILCPLSFINQKSGFCLFFKKIVYLCPYGQVE